MMYHKFGQAMATRVLMVGRVRVRTVRYLQVPPVVRMHRKPTIIVLSVRYGLFVCLPCAALAKKLSAGSLVLALQEYCDICSDELGLDRFFDMKLRSRVMP